MNDKPNHIPTVRTEIPKRISDAPTPIITDVPNDNGRNADYKRRLRNELEQAKEPKPTVKERMMNALLNQLLAFLKTWLFGRPVYKTRTNDKGEIEFIMEPVKWKNPETGIVENKRDDQGNIIYQKVMNKWLTVFSRLLQVLGATGLIGTVIAGKPISEWVPFITDLIRALTGG